MPTNFHVPMGLMMYRGQAVCMICMTYKLCWENTHLSEFPITTIFLTDSQLGIILCVMLLMFNLTFKVPLNYAAICISTFFCKLKLLSQVLFLYWVFRSVVLKEENEHRIILHCGNYKHSSQNSIILVWIKYEYLLKIISGKSKI